ncbi:NAD(P) transhydrogenase subunit alpha [Marinoscillum sp. MHG1-6]|uniref:NAD(P) transhydrogenase subunit alpha n=1 Tax=Marinoscillum sp. MHG1-6 TaxID=2959627 RepID=UPI0021578BC0|nr:NAD(P) transhydrogenase subunit alpha [Marinoscillum sp. MHG1-6]
MNIGILTSQSTPLVPIVPSIAIKYIKDGYDVAIESGAGMGSYFSDDDFRSVGVKVEKRATVLSQSDIILVDENISDDEIQSMSEEAILIGKFNVLSHPELAERLKPFNFRIFSLDLVPRSSIAQSMDVLSSLASLAGYKAVVAAAERFPGYFPMMTTAAGTVPPAKVLVLGAGVAGLQAIATAKRLGASVEAFDVRSAVKEEVESLGAKFIEVEGSVEDKGAGGYAVTQTAEYVQKQKELIHERAHKADVVISTANIPGKKAPVLIEGITVEAMKPGSVIIDMASATGGNCEFTQDNKEIEHKGVKIIGNSRLFHQLPKEASRLYSTNLYNFIKFILKEGPNSIPYQHEIVQKTLLTDYKLAETAS